MADVKISGLPASTTPLLGTEVLPIVQSGVTKQVSVANLTTGRDVNAKTLTLDATDQALSVKGGNNAVISQIITTDTTGNNYMQVFYTDTVQNRGSIQYNRGTGLMLYNTTSDVRLKKNILPVEDVGNLIDRIEIVSYDWKNNNSHCDYGVIAQELQKVVPQATLKGDENEQISELWQVDYSKIVPLLIKEIQSLRKRLKTANIA